MICCLAHDIEFLGRPYFASTTQPGTQIDDSWARWLAKPPCNLFSFKMFTKVDNDKGKLSAPKPDTKTPEKQRVENGLPPTKAVPVIGYPM